MLSPAHSQIRPFDLQYSRLGIPFSIFYNPGLLGNNSGYTFGFDAMHIDSANYDVRGAVVIPIGKVMKYDDHIRENSGNKYFKYANTSHKSSKFAISAGGMYVNEENFQLSAGFAVPLNLVQSGVAVDFTQGDDDPVITAKVGFSADIPPVMKGNLLHLTFHNLIATERNGANDFGISVGVSGIPFSSPRMFYMPYDFFFHVNLDSGGVSAVEGLARINLDLTSIYTSVGAAGQTVSASLGYNFIRQKNEAVTHKFFASLGVVFIGKSSSTAISGSYGDGDEKHGMIVYSAFGDNGVTGDKGIHAAMTVVKIDEKYLFDIESGGSSVRSWVLRIDDQKGANVKTFSGGNIVPSSILWDGLTSGGLPVEDGILLAKLVIMGKNSVIQSNTIEIERK
jgi:hypothetical protein